MTLISAFITIRGTAVATDSLLTIRDNENPGTVEGIEWQQSKLVRLQKFAGTISFWGSAVAEPILPLPPDKDLTEFKWTLYQWLTDKSKNVHESTIEEFVIRLTNELKDEYRKRNWGTQGLGVHITGYEFIDNTYIPELFLISNYSDTSYTQTRELSYSRETYHTLTDTPAEEKHRELAYRKVVQLYLNEGGFFIYNNGNPRLFNPVFNAFWDSYRASIIDGRAKKIETLKDHIAIVRRPIEIVSQFQSDFFKKDKILIGGRTHDLSVWRDGNYSSTSGD